MSPDGKNVYAVYYGVITVFDRDVDTGALAQRPDPNGCITTVPTAGCTTGKAFDTGYAITVSPDGKSVYVVSVQNDQVAVFDRDPNTGALTQKADPNGCITNVATTGCTTGKALHDLESIAVSPDNENVYIGTATGTAVFDRNTSTGVLTQKADPNGCLANTATAGCTTVKGAGGRLVISPDGKNVYTDGGIPIVDGNTSYNREVIGVLNRDTTTGILTQPADPNACLVEDSSILLNPGCTVVDKQINDVRSLVVPPDGKNLYLAGRFGVSLFDRSTTTGALTERPNPGGCFTDDSVHFPNCTAGKALVNANSITVSPDGKSAYVTAYDSDAVDVFDRNTTSGALTQKPYPKYGCIVDPNTPTPGDLSQCTAGKALDGANFAIVSPDSANVYVSSDVSNALAVFDRELVTLPSDPIAAISAAPTLALTGTAVQFTASNSIAPAGGTITNYSWDFDGNGTFEVDTGTSPTASRIYTVPGTFAPTVRVSSDWGTTTTSDTTSTSVEVRRAPPPGPVGISINSGATYTNNPDVTVSLVWPGLAKSALVSNDGGFQAAQSLGLIPQIAWHLEPISVSGGPSRYTKIVYVRYQGAGNELQTFSDDIVLDETPPTIESAQIVGGAKTATLAGAAREARGKNGRLLRLRAEDNRSGVGEMQVARRPKEAAVWMPFRSKVRIKRKRVFVRVRDGAGNSSAWRKAR